MSRMRVLVTPSEMPLVSEKKKGFDFSFTNPGELLTVSGPICTKGAAACGCDRSFTGLDTTKGTTVGVVAEMDAEEVANKVRESQFVKGWQGIIPLEEVQEDMNWISESLQNFAIGAPLGVKNFVRSRVLQDRRVLEVETPAGRGL